MNWRMVGTASMLLVASTLVVSTGFGGAPARDGSTNLLVIYGEVFAPDGVTHCGDGEEAEVVNMRTGLSGRATIGSVEVGRYSVVLLDIASNDAAGVGDTLLFSVVGATSVSPSFAIVGAADTETCLMRTDLLVTFVPSSLENTSWSRIKGLFAP